MSNDYTPPHGIARTAPQPELFATITNALDPFLAVAAAIGVAAQRSGNNLSTEDQLAILAALTQRLGITSPAATPVAERAAAVQRQRVLNIIANIVADGCSHSARALRTNLGFGAHDEPHPTAALAALVDVLG